MKGTDQVAVDAATSATAAKVAAGTASTAAVFADAAFSVMGVPLNVLLLAFTGSLIGLAVREKEPKRPPIYVMVLLYTLCGAYGAVLLPHVPFLGFLKEVPLTASALFMSLLSNWGFPVLAAEIPDMMRRVFRSIGSAKDVKDLVLPLPGAKSDTAPPPAANADAEKDA